MNEESIFVQIASYRDPELVPTILDMFETAENPDNLHICICWQHDEFENLDIFNTYPNIEIIDVPYQKSKGACWARNLIQRHYNGERYTLQIDSHHRFVNGWDTSLKEMYSQCVSMGSKKPILTSYVPSFNPLDSKETYETVPWRMDFYEFTDEGTVLFVPNQIQDYEKFTSPIPARFYSAHFAFTDGKFCEEVSHDPEYYFYGEEISITVRAFTYGYDLYHPHKVIIWHEYTREARIKHWDDHDLNKSIKIDKSWWERDASSHKRNRVLFGIDNDESIIISPKYQMGTQRSISDYERYAGINFKDQTISLYTLSGKFAPTPNNQNYVSGKTSSVNIKTITKTVSIPSKLINHQNVSLIKLDLYNKDDKLIISQSIDKKFILSLLTKIDPISISINFDAIEETSYYCKLHVYDLFDRIIVQSVIDI